LTDSHVKSNSLDDKQELLNNGHHKIAFNYDKDTISLVEESTLTTLKVSLSNDSDSSAWNAPIAFEIIAMILRLTHLDSTIMGQST
jgi:hypothetical protein